MKEGKSEPPSMDQKQKQQNYDPLPVEESPTLRIGYHVKEASHSNLAAGITAWVDHSRDTSGKLSVLGL